MSYELELPPQTPAGRYFVKVGMYYWETGERLPVWDGTMTSIVDDAIPLETPVVAK